VSKSGKGVVVRLQIASTFVLFFCFYFHVDASDEHVTSQSRHITQTSKELDGGFQNFDSNFEILSTLRQNLSGKPQAPLLSSSQEGSMLAPFSHRGAVQIALCPDMESGGFTSHTNTLHLRT
ncbi:hypothetical protein BaRGS_00027002, partial [Batillaria attramentaria]